MGDSTLERSTEFIRELLSLKNKNVILGQYAQIGCPATQVGMMLVLPISTIPPSWRLLGEDAQAGKICPVKRTDSIMHEILMHFQTALTQELKSLKEISCWGQPLQLQAKFHSFKISLIFHWRWFYLRITYFCHLYFYLKQLKSLIAMATRSLFLEMRK